MFRDAGTFPVRDAGWVMILLGAGFSLLLDLASSLPLIGFVAALFAAGYFSAFYLSIISATMVGDDRMPDWPSPTAFLDDIVMPLLRVLGLTIFSFAPALAVAVWMEVGPYRPAALLAAVAFGCIYFPMAALGSLTHGNLFGALPHVVLPGVFRAGPWYWVAVGVMAVVFAAIIGVEIATEKLPLVGVVVSTVLGLYNLMFQARLIGLIYRERGENLRIG